ncbi:MAG: MBL fold metallo-hydrolase [Candidatus Thermoplasmatota archaeon]|jgi:glyoxylase-like metal-dependent hydrolase (beta-lactamase superfamily II)|nr:MBL fold metallo-hydrolase [Candidatus Thermoplasmatota archaeon]
MDEVLVIRNGHARRSGSTWYASSTVTVVRSGRKTLVVDPGCSGNLEDQLGKASVWPEEVGMVFITHGHPDHYLNVSLFKEAVILDGTYIYEEDRQTPLGGMVPGTGIRIVQTPGHTPDHASLLVESAGLRHLIAGDLFWWEDGALPGSTPEALLGLPDETALDPSILKGSRESVLNDADLLIPGHGQMVRIARPSQ